MSAFWRRQAQTALCQVAQAHSAYYKQCVSIILSTGYSPPQPHHVRTLRANKQSLQHACDRLERLFTEFPNEQGPNGN